MRSFAASTGLLWKTGCCAPIPHSPPSRRDKGLDLGLGLGRVDVRAVTPCRPPVLVRQAPARKEWDRWRWVTAHRVAPVNPTAAACGGRTTQADPRVRLRK